MSNYSKKGSRTALGLVLSLSLIAASTASQAALWGLFGEEKDPLKTEKRSPALNSSTSMYSAPSPNLVYGSLPETQPIDYTSSAPTPPVMQSPVAPVALNAPATPQYIGTPPAPNAPLPDALAMNPLIATPANPAAMQPRPTTNIAMPPAQFAPAPMAAPMAPMGMPPMDMSMGMPMPPEPPANIPLSSPMGLPPVPVQQFQASPNVGADGYPKLSSIPATPMAAPSAVNPRADNLRNELQVSQNMIGDTKPYKTAAPADAVRPKNNPAPTSMASAPMAPAPMAPKPMATNPDFIAMPPAQFAPAPAMAPAPMPAAPMMASNSVQPVFPSGPSVTVRSKRAGGGAVTTPMGNQQAYMPMPAAPAPMAPAPSAFANDAAIDVAMASPTPTIEKVSMAPVAPMAPMPKTTGSAFAPAPISPLVVPEIKNQRMVGESAQPVASAYDAPIDSYNGGGYTGNSNFGLSGNSYTVGSHGRAGSGHTAMLPKSRYASYRNNNR